MGWVVVPCLLEGRDQLNARFPNRAKNAEGTIGNQAHAVSTSSHNPDETGKPEFSDHDGRDEVRAADFDKNLNDPQVTMEDVVQLWVLKARAGLMPFIRYIIFNGRIWHRRDNFVTRQYTGSDNHSSHAHVNSDFNQAADNATGTNWYLAELGKPSTPVPPSSPINKAHPVLKKGDTGVFVDRLQTYLRTTYPAYRNSVFYMIGKLLGVDGVFGGQTEAWVKEFQKRCGLLKDGVVGPKTLAELRRRGYKY